MALFNARDSSRSSIPGRSNGLLLAAFGWLSYGAITPTISSAIPTNDATDAVGIALTPEAPGMGGIGHLNRLGLQLSPALKNQAIQRRHANQRRMSLLSNTPMHSTSLR